MIYRFDTLTSTNDEARDARYRHGDLILAERQTAGRGQRGHTWISPEGTNLTFTLVVEPTFLAARDQFLLSEVVALALGDCLDRFGIPTRIKWTNDIYYGDYKLVGILIEHFYSGSRLQRHDAAGSKCIGLAALLGHGVVVDHGIHVTAHDQKAQTGLAQSPNAVGVLPVRLGYDAHLEACILQHTGDDGVAEGGMVHIGVADNVYKITLFPASALHVGAGNGEKISYHRVPSSGSLCRGGYHPPAVIVKSV